MTNESKIQNRQSKILDFGFAILDSFIRITLPLREHRMSAFHDCKQVEAESFRQLTPLIERRAFRGRYVTTAKGRLAAELQRKYGDLFMNRPNGDVCAVEIKAEREEKFGNFFFEEWSNRLRETPGWMRTLDVDWLLYHFLRDARPGFIYPAPIAGRRACSTAFRFRSSRSGPTSARAASVPKCRAACTTTNCGGKRNTTNSTTPGATRSTSGSSRRKSAAICTCAFTASGFLMSSMRNGTWRGLWGRKRAEGRGVRGEGGVAARFACGLFGLCHFPHPRVPALRGCLTPFVPLPPSCETATCQKPPHSPAGISRIGSGTPSASRLRRPVFGVVCWSS